MNDLYETDIALWSEHQANLLRRRAAGQLVNDADLDWSNIAEEIEAVGRSERSQLRSLITTAIEHLMRLEASPAMEPRRGWKATIRRTRRDIRDLLKESPSLRPLVAAMVADQMQRAREDLVDWLAEYAEQPRVDIDSLGFADDQVLVHLAGSGDSVDGWPGAGESGLPQSGGNRRDQPPSGAVLASQERPEYGRPQAHASP
ncbi:DUF29 domain-containing protein [Rhodopila globiformis]|uniref:DUF29 domain-containing protein n=1 Tax=Rhodopila globiformis TaxID=1071 RepID=A0A2S6NK56_RHOGL|nr:DUF29 domain-containing protein [Rhodopila globiformis]PPQ35321.1 hypothetical protein CCS01_08235 [Rhodopila globiformis]